MEEKVIVRLATGDDAGDIKKITDEAFAVYAKNAGTGDNLAALNETLEDIIGDIENKNVFIAFSGGRAAGSLRIDIKDSTAYLSRFGVLCDFQKNGIGRALMSSVDEHMIKSGVKQLCLHTASKVSSLMRFYYGCGFYAESVSSDRGYLRAHLCKDYTPDGMA